MALIDLSMDSRNDCINFILAVSSKPSAVLTSPGPGGSACSPLWILLGSTSEARTMHVLCPTLNTLHSDMLSISGLMASAGSSDWSSREYDGSYSLCYSSGLHKLLKRISKARLPGFGKKMHIPPCAAHRTMLWRAERQNKKMRLGVIPLVHFRKLVILKLDTLTCSMSCDGTFVDSLVTWHRMT